MVIFQKKNLTLNNPITTGKYFADSLQLNLK